MGLFDFIKKAAGKVLSGIKKVGSKVLKPIKKVKDAIKNTYNKVRDAPIVGEFIKTGESFLPGFVKKGVGVVDNAIDLGDKALKGDVRGALNEGRDLYNSIRR